MKQIFPLLAAMALVAPAQAQDGFGGGAGLAAGLLLLVLLLLGAAWGGMALRRRWRAMRRCNRELRAALDRAEAKARMLDGALAAMADGIMVTDAALHVVGWNPGFAVHSGVPAGKLRIGMPIEAVLRLQAEAGEFGMVDPEAEVTRRMALLRSSPLPHRWVRDRPDGSRLELRRAPLPGGGFVTLYCPVAAASGPAATPPMQDAFRAEWDARLPRLTAAAADGDALSIIAAAHALRGIAANAGWEEIAGMLSTIETAAQHGVVTEARLMVALLPAEPPAG